MQNYPNDFFKKLFLKIIFLNNLLYYYLNFLIKKDFNFIMLLILLIISNIKSIFITKQTFPKVFLTINERNN